MLYFSEILEKINQILNEYQPISLKEMDKVALLNRVDTKFVIDYDKLYSILNEVKNDYRVLTIKERRFNSYETIYFDTADFKFYTLHHRGKTNRFKFRKRKYIESDLSFLEIKFKNNKKRTIKNRVSIDDIEMDLNEDSKNYIQEVSQLDLELIPTLVNQFTRITLVSNYQPERLTIDLGLRFIANDKDLQLKNTVIIEAKQEKIQRDTPFMAALKKRLVRPNRISKYCFGMAMTHEHLKQNNFKQRIKKIKQLENGNAA